MYDEVIKNLEKQLSDNILEKIKSKRIHLGILTLLNLYVRRQKNN